MKADERVARQVGQALRRLRLDLDFGLKQVAGHAGIIRDVEVEPVRVPACPAALAL